VFAQLPTPQGNVRHSFTSCEQLKPCQPGSQTQVYKFDVPWVHTPLTHGDVAHQSTIEEQL
jgi:hypothetical protein